MDEHEQDCPVPTQLFTLRVWREALGEGMVEWRGKVQHVMTGEARYFRGWQMLASQLESLLAGIESGASASPASPRTSSPGQP